MSVMFSIKINMPYSIKLKEDMDYKFDFEYPDTKNFHIEFWKNEDSQDEDHIKCNSIWVSGIYNNIDYTKFKLDDAVCVLNKDEKVYCVKMPETERKEVFSHVREKVNNILSYLREQTNILCIAPLMMLDIGYDDGESIEYCFYSPNAKLTSKMAYWESHIFRIEERQLDENIFNGFDCNINYNEPKRLYIRRAEKAIYEGDYDQFIVYASIAVEAFADKYINEITKGKSKDIVLNAINKTNSDYLNKYYNILLKYLLGKSLIEEKENNYTLIKRMYKLRNALMHTGEITQNDLTNSGLSNLGYSECNSILESIKDTFSWMESLI